jgi:FHS family L-fucose permease-like MFS transporter
MEQSLTYLTAKNKFSILSTFGVSFFIWGVITGLNLYFIEHLKNIFNISYSVSSLIHLVFFSTYLIVSLPAGKLIKNWGYKLGLIIGLFTTGLGCMLFYFAIHLQQYYFFLLAMAVQATGITLLQVGANLYILFFGQNKTAPSRLTLMQGLNAFGAFLAPVYGSSLVESIFGLNKGINELTIKTIYVQSPYILLSIVMYVLTIFFVFIDIPEYSTEKIEPLNEKSNTIRYSHVMHFKQLRLGAFAVFAYLGAEVALGNFLITFFPGQTKYYWGAALAGRLLGALILLKITPSKVLAIGAATATSLLFISILTTGDVSIWTAIAIGLFNSIMFPCIYSLGLSGLGKFSEQGSAIMIMAFVGAGVIPFNAGNFSAVLGYKIGFIFPIVCYVYIMFYAIKGSKFSIQKDNSTSKAFLIE